MLLVNETVFDESLSGTEGGVWYTEDRYNKLLGLPDSLVVMAHVTNVAGTLPGLTVAVENSADNQHWFLESTALIPPTTITENQVLYGVSTTFYLSFVRLAVALTGSNPRCRLKLSVVGRGI